MYCTTVIVYVYAPGTGFELHTKSFSYQYVTMINDTKIACSYHCRICSYTLTKPCMLNTIIIGAQRYRALMVILQSHRTQNFILRCYLTASAILQRHTKSCLLCFFNNPYILSFLFTCVYNYSITHGCAPSHTSFE